MTIRVESRVTGRHDVSTFMTHARSVMFRTNIFVDEYSVGVVVIMGNGSVLVWVSKLIA